MVDTLQDDAVATAKAALLAHKVERDMAEAIKKGAREGVPFAFTFFCHYLL